MSLRLTVPTSRLSRVALPVAAAGVLLVGMLTGCSLSKEQHPASASQSTPVSGAGFTARTVSGEPIKIPGGRPTVVLFFSVECGGCGPTANALAQAQADQPAAANFVVVDVASYESESDIKGFLDANRAPDLGYASDADGQLIAQYEVTQLSTVLVLDDANRVVFRAIEPSADEIRAELAKATGS